ncbi:MAG: sigma 54-interacting transcriptional regulator [Acidobacteria bacterium]|nr:sigma 54-interacting transcriptional regulator [Acidobacteriota bacterium]
MLESRAPHFLTEMEQMGLSLSYESTKALFAIGHYRRIIEQSGISDAAVAPLDQKHRLLIAQALIHSDIQRACEMAQREYTSGSPPSARSTCELIIGLAQRRGGAFEKAITHFGRAIQLAIEAGNENQIAWGYLHLFRLLVEIQPHEAALTTLREVRRHVTRAGDAHAVAYMHNSIALIEGSTGRLDEARRHLRISDSLIEGHPNAWLSQVCALSRFCVAFLASDYATAARYLEEGRRFLPLIGSDYLGTVFDCNEGHTALVRGRFQKAENILRRVVESSHTYSVLGALDGLARLYLATNRLDDCEVTLGQIDSFVAADSRLQTGLTSRCAAITRVKLSLRKGSWDTALSEMSKALAKAAAVNDESMMSALAFLKAEVLSATGRFREAANSLLVATQTAPLLPERRAEFHYSTAAVLKHARSALTGLINQRALSIWKQAGDRLGPAENGRGPHTYENPSDLSELMKIPAEVPSDLRSVAVANVLANVFDLATSPALMGSELVNVIRILKCSPKVALEEHPRDARGIVPISDEYAVPLGEHRGKRFTLVCRVPDDPLHSVVLGDVLRLAQASLALERFRQDERSRAAIWPEPPVEEQAGALFLAEEMQTLLATARRIAPTTVPVLLTGETGTGKEVLARTIHAYSTRASAAFLPFNCSGVPKDMLDAQLFGHRRGAFTGAVDHFPGVIRTAAGGTLFLDEIGETTLDVQPKLLRFLDSGEIHPVGEARPLRVDVRVIAATNADLDALVAQGRFREDLFYRLNIVRLHLPPLRERRVEIPALANHYLQKYAQEYRKGPLRLAEETMEYLVLYRWPGNVRQLANEMRRMAALAEAGAVLMPEHVSPEIAASRRTVPASERALDPTEVVVRLDQPVPAAIQHLERAMIQYALRKCGGSMEETARLLGLSRKGLYLKRLRYGLEPPDSASPAIGVA